MPERIVLPSRAKPVKLPLPEGAVGGETAEVDIVFDMDDSGSMYGSWGDPTGVRYAAALSVIELMARLGGGRAGVVHWGSTAPAEMVLWLTDVRKGKRKLTKALVVPPVTLGGNDFPAALIRTAEVLAGSESGRTQLVVGLTDGIEHLGPLIHTALASLPGGSVHVLLVDRSNGCDASLESQWRSLPVSFCRLETVDTTKMAWQIAEALAGHLGLRMPSSEDAEPPMYSVGQPASVSLR